MLLRSIYLDGMMRVRYDRGGIGCTVCAVFQSFYFDTSSTIPAAIFCMLANIFPGEVCAEPVDFSAVVANEEYEVLGREIASAAPVCQSASLNNLDGD